jgi:amino-acid N-acetyltransferase
MSEPFTIRRATPRDQLAITTLVRNEHLNPIDLDWRRFVIATDESGVLGAVQLRKHADRSRELASLAVRHDARKRGVAARLIDRLLARIATRVLMITGAAFAAHYERWGFRPIEPAKAPAAVRRNYYFGKIAGGAISLLSGRWPRQLAILDRNPSTRSG